MANFDVLLTVHLSIILVINQPNVQILFFFYFHCYTVHVVEFTQLIHQLMQLYKSYTLQH